jgi:hypothetical protein
LKAGGDQEYSVIHLFQIKKQYAMHTPGLGFVAICATSFVLAACQATQPQNATGNSEPKIISSLRSNGKGTPNGRTDSALPYLRMTKLALSSDPSYGYTPDKPVKTGPVASRFHLLYLNSLRGPNSEVVEYERVGSCCEFEDKSLPLGGGLLDVYKVRIDGSRDVLMLYVDMYRQGVPQFPVGFTARR